MVQKLAYAVAILWGAIPVGMAVFVAVYGNPAARLVGLPMAIIFSLVAWFMWTLVKRGYVLPVLFSPIVIGGILALRIL